MNITTTDALGFLRSFSDKNEVTNKIQKKIDKILPDLLDSFYEELQRSPVKALFGSGTNLESLKQSQKQHWTELFRENLSQKTMDRASHIGQVHERAGLPASFYIAAYGWVLTRLIPEFSNGLARSSNQTHMIQMLIQRVFTDMVLSVGAYEETFNARKALESEKIQTQNMANIAQSIAETNKIILQLAFLQRSARSVSQNSQTISSASTELVASVKEIAHNSETASD